MAVCCHCTRQVPVSRGSSLWLYDPANRAVVWRRQDLALPGHLVRSFSAAQLAESAAHQDGIVEGYTPVIGFGGFGTPGPVDIRLLDYSAVPQFGGETTYLTSQTAAATWKMHGIVHQNTVETYPEVRYSTGQNGTKKQWGWYPRDSGGGRSEVGSAVYWTPSSGSPGWIQEFLPFGAFMHTYEQMIPPIAESGALRLWHLRAYADGGGLGDVTYDLWNYTWAPGVAVTTDYDITRSWLPHVDVAGPAGTESSLPWAYDGKVYHFKYVDGAVRLQSWDAYTGEEVGDQETDLTAVVNRGHHGDGVIWVRSADGTKLHAIRPDGSTLSTYNIPSTDRAMIFLSSSPGNGGGFRNDFFWQQPCPNGDFLYWAGKGTPVTSYDLVRVDKDLGTEKWRYTNAASGDPGYTTCIGDNVYANVRLSGSLFAVVHIDSSGSVVWQSVPASGGADNYSLQAAIEGPSSYILMAGHLPT